MRVIFLIGLATISSCVSHRLVDTSAGYNYDDGMTKKHVRKRHKQSKQKKKNKHGRLPFNKVPQRKIGIAGHHSHVFHHLINHVQFDVTERPPTPALDLMKRIAGSVIPRSHHPALAEIVKVAQELVDSRDETLAAATVETFHESLVKLSEVSRDEPPVTGAIADMRADVCGSQPDLHQEECMAFMKQYCAANSGKEACANFFKTDEKPAEKEEPGTKKEGKETTKKQEKKDDGPPPEPIPEQGFSGKPVAHIDGETATDDWRREFGPGQADSYEGACAQHPNNQWCIANGYAPLFHSGASKMGSMRTCVVSLFSAALVTTWFL